MKIFFKITTLGLFLTCLSLGAFAQQKDWGAMEYFMKDSTFRAPVEPEQGAAELEALKGLYSDKASWEARRACLQKGIREALMIPPTNKKAPRAVYSDLKTMDGYTVENVAVEAFDGLWVTGNLYRPLDGKKKHPAILSVQGHGRAEPSQYCARFGASSQRMCAMLAKMGAVVFNYDMFANGESGLHVGYKAHRLGLAQAVQTVSSIRVIDFLSSLKEVDAKRIGMTGASGGGTQTFLATAVDERIAVSVPVVQVSSFFPGGCPCESGRPIHLMCDPISNNAEIASMAAPRPMLVVSDGKDWTRTVDQVEFPFISRTYGFYGKQDRSKNVHLPLEGHDYGISKREAMYDFMADHLGLDNTTVKKVDGHYDESGVKPLDWERLLVFPDKKLPQGYLDNVEAIFNKLKALSEK